MDAEYMEDIAKKSQIAQSAHKGASKPKWPMTGENGPVMVWPDLPTVRARLEYITAGMLQVEIANRLGVAPAYVSQMLKRAETLRRSTLAGWAKEFGCPLDWLCGNVKKPQPAEFKPDEDLEHTKLNQFPAYRLEIHGVYSPEAVAAMLPTGERKYRYTIHVEGVEDA